MQAIIIGAGRGRRLMPATADAPKCFAEVDGRSILSWTLEAFRRNGIDRICFIGGYQIDKVCERHPDFSFRHNADWQNNNILASLFHAEDLMTGPFFCCYSDILFTPDGLRDLLASRGEVSLLVDTDWLARYEHRKEHPSGDAEKVIAANGRVKRIHRAIADSDAHGEFVGVAKFSAEGAAQLREHYHRCRQASDGGPFREARSFGEAYLIHLLQEMIEAGVEISHVDTPGGYIEIDTQEDFDYARRHWESKHLKKTS